MHCTNLAGIVAKMVEHSEVDLIFGCGVGGHRQGCARENLKVKDFLDHPFGQHVLVAEVDNYIAVYGMTPPPHTMLHGIAEKYAVPGADGDVDAVITRFDVFCVDTDGVSHAVHIVAGNMHISCGANPLSIKKRMLMVQQLRRRLEEFSAADSEMPTVRLIVGDDNLSTEEALRAHQQMTEEDPLWVVLPALHEGTGDHVAVSGAAASAVNIPIGRSWEDKGMPHAQHDVVAVRLRVRVAAQLAENSADSHHGRGAVRIAKEEVPDSGDEQDVASGAARVLGAASLVENSDDGEDDRDASKRVQEEAPDRERGASRGGASQPATKRRKAWDGEWYTEEEFEKYYGDPSCWGYRDRYGY